MKRRSTAGVALRVAMTLISAAACVIGATGATGARAQTVAAGATGKAHASSAGSRSSTGRIGEATGNWLDLQRTNAAAAPALPMPGAQATLAYERYMNSFRSKIPASFGSALSGEGGGQHGDYTNAGAGAAPSSDAH